MHSCALGSAESNTWVPYQYTRALRRGIQLHELVYRAPYQRAQVRGLGPHLGLSSPVRHPYSIPKELGGVRKTTPVLGSCSPRTWVCGPLPAGLGIPHGDQTLSRTHDTALRSGEPLCAPPWGITPTRLPACCVCTWLTPEPWDAGTGVPWSAGVAKPCGTSRSVPAWGGTAGSSGTAACEQCRHVRNHPWAGGDSTAAPHGRHPLKALSPLS